MFQKNIEKKQYFRKFSINIKEVYQIHSFNKDYFYVKAQKYIFF